MNESKEDFLEMSFDILTDKEKFIITYSFGLYGNSILKQKEIAFLLERSQSDISQVKKRALRKIKSYYTKDLG